MVKYELPPLILHPFGTGPVTRTVLESRYAEIRMLFFVGKDVFRWLAQCREWAEHQKGLSGLREQSFAQFLTANPPRVVADKLHQWGVADFQAVFIRSIGIKSIFEEVPQQEELSEIFLTYYYHFADGAFDAFQSLVPFEEIDPQEFQFNLYASAEYSRLLEQEWQTGLL